VSVGDTTPGKGRPLVTRLTPAGASDDSFGDHGVVSLTVGRSLDDVVVRADGRIVASGTRVDGHVFLVGLTADGSLDSTFGNDGFVFTSIVANYSDRVALLPTAEGALVARTDGFRILVARFKQNRPLDPRLRP